MDEYILLENHFFLILSLKNIHRQPVYIKELQIIAQGDSLASAHEDLVRKKEAYLSQMKEAGKLDSLPEASTPPTLAQKLFKQEIALFISKSLIAGFIFLLILNFAVNKIDRIITLKATTLPKKILWQLEEDIDFLANKKISPERIEKLRNNLSKTIKKIQPLLGELSSTTNSKPDIEKNPSLESKPKNSLASE